MEDILRPVHRGSEKATFIHSKSIADILRNFRCSSSRETNDALCLDFGNETRYYYAVSIPLRIRVARRGSLERHKITFQIIRSKCMAPLKMRQQVSVGGVRHNSRNG